MSRNDAPHAGSTDASFALALARSVVRRLPRFGVAWIGTTLVWVGVLLVEAHVSISGAGLVLLLQLAVLASTIGVARRLAHPRSVLAAVVIGCVVLGVSATGIFVAVAGNADFLAFVLLTLYLAASVSFRWGWRPSVLLLIATAVPWLLVLPRLATHVPAAELVGAILVGSALSITVAEGYERSFRYALRREDERDAVRLRERAALAEAERLRALAEAATQAKDRVLTIVSHDLRGPLSAVRGWAYFLRRQPSDATSVLRAVEGIERSIETSLRLIRDLLDNSRAATGKLHLEMRGIDLRGVVSAVADSARLAAEKKGIDLVVGLPDGPVHIHGDAVRLRQIFENLLSNAVKFTPPAGRVDVQLATESEVAELTVRDTGIGIPAGVLPHVFEPFRQADGAATGSSQGLGLGLAIAHQLAEAHGATIHAESGGERCGATFRVRFPRLRDIEQVAS